MCILVGMLIGAIWMGMIWVLGKLCKIHRSEADYMTGKLYTYYCLKRPPSSGSLPAKGLVHASAYDEYRYVFEIDKMAYGYALYSRQLAPWEIMRYDLMSEPDAGDRE